MKRTIGLLLLAFLVGCGGHKSYPVEGTVTTENGTPIADALIEFTPLEQDKVFARGKSGPDGKYHLTTSVDGDGVAAGEYRVRVKLRMEAMGKMKPESESCTVKSGQTNLHDIRILPHLPKIDLKRVLKEH